MNLGMGFGGGASFGISTGVPKVSTKDTKAPCAATGRLLAVSHDEFCGENYYREVFRSVHVGGVWSFVCLFSL